MSLTSLIRPFMVARSRRAMAAHDDVEGTQRTVLRTLIKRASDTEWGRAHGYRGIGSYGQYRQDVDITPYEKLRPMVMRMIEGEPGVLWPGVTRRFAQSSGTSDGKSKYIPVTADSLKANHYRGASDAVAHYLNFHNPGSRVFDGRAFILGGSFANELSVGRGVRVGDLSANLIEAINPLVNLLRVPSKSVALMENWHDKLPVLAHAAVGRNITNISGVPSWFLTVLREVTRIAGTTTVAEVWPGLEVFFHGGISFEPYRAQYRDIIGNPAMHYVETYNASEGFFATQDSPDTRAMSLVLDAGMFYEFQNTATGAVVPAWEVNEGEIYSLLLSGANGLWRYPIGDTVRIESTSPLRITIAGRTKHFINAFGEELMVHNADAAIATACALHHCSVANYTAAPQFTPGSGANGYHQWLIEFDTEPRSTDAFAMTLDRELRHLNSDYEAKRSGDIFLAPPQIVTARRGLFDRWLESTGKLGGQRKVPRLYNSRRFIDAMLTFNTQ